MAAIGWYNGTAGPLDTMTVPMLDRAVYFGDGCYEALKAIGRKPFALEAHLDRFYKSLSALEIPAPLTREALKAALFDCLFMAEEPRSVLYWQASRGTARRTHAFPEHAAPNLMITVTPLLPEPDRALTLITAEDIRYRMCDVKTLNLLPNVLCNERAKRAGADGAILVRDGFVTEGTHTNVHLLKGGTLYTHPADERILAGVTRGIVLNFCETLCIPVSETAFPPDALFTADEVFVTSSVLGIRRVERVDGVPVGGRAPERFGAICAAYEQRFSEETNA